MVVVVVVVVVRGGGWYLLNGGLSLEEDTAAEEFSEDAADAPDVYGGRVVTRSHQDLRSAVVLRHHLLRHGFTSVGLLHARQSEITYLSRSQTETVISINPHIMATETVAIRASWTHFEQAVAVDQ